MEKNEILEKYKGLLLGEINYIRNSKSNKNNDLYAEDFLDEKEAAERFFEVTYHETTLTDEGKKFTLEYFGFVKIVEMAFEASKKYTSVKYDKKNIEKQLKGFLL